jgi:hypothetical protein
MVASSAPLLNEYKEQFFWKRLPQTVFGGLRLKLGYRSPFYVYALQIALFLLPAIVGGFFSCLVELADVSLTVGASVCGVVLGVIVLFLHIFVYWRRERSSPVQRFNGSVLDEDDQIEFTSCYGPETLGFIIVPKKQHSVFIHSVVCGGLGAGAMTYLLPSRLSDLFTTGPVIAIVLFGWITICIVHHSLAFSAPPEPAQFTPQDIFEFAVLTRPFYAALFLSFDFAARYVHHRISIIEAGYHVCSLGLNVTTFSLLLRSWTLSVHSLLGIMMNYETQIDGCMSSFVVYHCYGPLVSYHH